MLEVICLFFSDESENSQSISLNPKIDFEDAVDLDLSYVHIIIYSRIVYPLFPVSVVSGSCSLTRC